MTTPELRRKRIMRLVTLAVALGLWFVPPPGALKVQAWHLFAIFAATILSGTLSAEDAYAGFANPTVVLIIVAFLVARAVVKCGLGGRFVLKMNPVILLGGCAGAGTATPALRAIQDEAQRKVPVLGYTVPYAIGAILPTAWGSAIVLLTR